jgi:ATPase subunit of ABC transporter with duplicated ATPase domains
MLVIRDVGYKINEKILFENISFSVPAGEKVAIVGRNGIGKSVLLKIIVGELEASSGEVLKPSISYFPQKFQDYSSVADVFGLEKQVVSLGKISEGLEDYSSLEGHWDCEEIILKKMELFGLKFDLLRKFSSLSGGEKTKLILASRLDGDFLLLDESTNNMDRAGRRVLYDFVKNWKGGLLCVSHDRELLSLVDKIVEMRTTGLFAYGGNFDFWQKQKQLEEDAQQKNYNDALRHEKIKRDQTQDNLERFQRGFGKKGMLDPYGKLKAVNIHYDKNILKTLVKANDKMEDANTNIKEIQKTMDLSNNIYFKFNESKFTHKILVEVQDLTFYYGKPLLQNFNLLLKGGERIAIEGGNGSGKTTLLRLLQGKIEPLQGKVRVNTDKIAHLDQHCDFLLPHLSILENIILNKKSEKENRDQLASFLFWTESVHKIVKDLSGGERLRAALACLLEQDTELLLLDEPTNNMDLEGLEMLEKILGSYNGGLVMVSHDEEFKRKIGINRRVELPTGREN